MPAVRRNLPTILLALSLPAGLLGYLLGGRVVAAVAPGSTLVELFVPLFVAGLCMMPFLVPWLDRRAKADLAAIRALREEPPDGSRPGRLGRTDEPAGPEDRDEPQLGDDGDGGDDGDEAGSADPPR
jgi:hypothetical protein